MLARRPDKLHRSTGHLAFLVHSNSSCSGPGPQSLPTLRINQTAAELGFGGGLLFLENATSTWSGGGQDGGYVTGYIGLNLPEAATLNLVAGMPVNGGAPLPARVATISGTVTAQLTFTGSLTDPNTRGHDLRAHLFDQSMPLPSDRAA